MLSCLAPWLMLAAGSLAASGPSAAPVPTAKDHLELKQPSPVTALAWSPDGTLAVGGEDEAVRLWAVPPGKQVLSFPAGPKAVSALAFAPDGKSLLVGTASGTVSHRRTNGELIANHKHEGTARFLAFHPDGKSFNVATTGEWALWGVAEPATPVQRKKKTDSAPHGGLWLAKGEFVMRYSTIWGDGEHSVHFHYRPEATAENVNFDPRHGNRHTKRSEGEGRHALDPPFAVAPDRNAWARATPDGEVVWHAFGWAGKHKAIAGGKGVIRYLAFLDAKSLLAVEADGRVRRFDVEAAKSAPGEAIAKTEVVALSPDGKRLAWRASAKVVEVRDVTELLRKRP
jgi:WD40 repeat protein